MTNIVLLSHGRLRLLIQAITSLYTHTDPKEFNLVIVSDSELDFRVSKYLRSLEYRNLSLLEVHNSTHVIAQLKNLGVAWSEQRFGCGDWLYLSDSDVCFLPGWIGKLTAFADETDRLGYRLWGGQIHPFHKSNGVCGDVYDLEVATPYYSVLDGPGWLMRWKTWYKYGPFDRASASGVCQSEEFPFCKRLREDGKQIGVIQPHVIVHTGITNSNGDPAPGAEERKLMIPAGVIAE